MKVACPGCEESDVVNVLAIRTTRCPTTRGQREGTGVSENLNLFFFLCGFRLCSVCASFLSNPQRRRCPERKLGDARERLHERGPAGITRLDAISGLLAISAAKLAHNSWRIWLAISGESDTQRRGANAVFLIAASLLALGTWL